jgi:hypothetical protein
MSASASPKIGATTPIAFLTPVKRRGADGRAIAAETDFLDPRLCVLQATLTLAAEGIAFGIKRNRFIKAGVTAFEALNNGFQTLERIFER